MSTIITIKDKNVYYAGKVVGTVVSASRDTVGMKVILNITDDRIKRWIVGSGEGLAEFEVKV